MGGQGKRLVARLNRSVQNPYVRLRVGHRGVLRRVQAEAMPACAGWTIDRARAGG